MQVRGGVPNHLPWSNAPVAPAASKPPRAPLREPSFSPSALAQRDQRVFQAMLWGEIDVAAGLARIASSGGFPIQTAQGFIVVSEHPAALAGDHNGWRPRPMNVRNGLWWSHVPAARQEQIKYKLVDEQGAMYADPKARRYTYDEHGEVSLMRSSGGHLERWTMSPVGASGGDIASRTIRVWVPKEKPTHHLYVHDGQNLFDPQAPWGGWQLQHSVGPRTLIVGVDHGADRLGELTPGQRGEAYARFIEHTLRPAIEARYGVPARVGVMGSSLGGLMALLQWMMFPDAYDFVASLSGTMWWETHGTPFYKRVLAHEQELPEALYLDSGGAPGRGDNYESNLALVQGLRAQQRADGLTYYHDVDAPHREYAWRQRAHRPLQIFESMPAGGAEVIPFPHPGNGARPYVASAARR